MTPVDIDKLKEQALRIVAQLRASAPSASKALQMMAEAKSLRQGHNPPCKDLYAWPKPEETTEARAADLIETLIAKAERVDALERALTEDASTFDQFAAALREHDPAAMAQEIAVAELAAAEARNALSPKPEDAAPPPETPHARHGERRRLDPPQ